MFIDTTMIYTAATFPLLTARISLVMHSLNGNPNIRLCVTYIVMTINKTINIQKYYTNSVMQKKCNGFQSRHWPYKFYRCTKYCVCFSIICFVFGHIATLCMFLVLQEAFVIFLWVLVNLKFSQKPKKMVNALEACLLYIPLSSTRLLTVFPTLHDKWSLSTRKIAKYVLEKNVREC